MNAAIREFNVDSDIGEICMQVVASVLVDYQIGISANGFLEPIPYGRMARSALMQGGGTLSCLNSVESHGRPYPF